jgi:hypothetical protein
MPTLDEARAALRHHQPDVVMRMAQEIRAEAAAALAVATEMSARTHSMKATVYTFATLHFPAFFSSRMSSTRCE